MIVATDFKCFQFLSLIGLFLPEVSAPGGKVHKLKQPSPGELISKTVQHISIIKPVFIL